MLIPIKRAIVKSGLEVEILLNTRYVVKIEETQVDEGKPRTRILIDPLDREHKGPEVIYTHWPVSYIRGLVTRAKNNGGQDE